MAEFVKRASGTFIMICESVTGGHFYMLVGNPRHGDWF
jgi:hypothetical protein